MGEGRKGIRRMVAGLLALTATLLASATAPSESKAKLFAVSVEVYAVPSATQVRYTASRVTVMKGGPGSFSDAAVGLISGNGFQEQMRDFVKKGRAIAISTQVVTNLSGSLFRSISGAKAPTGKTHPSKWRVTVEGTLDPRGLANAVDFNIKVEMGQSKKWLIDGSQLVASNQSLLVSSHPKLQKQRAGEYRIVVVIDLKEQVDDTLPAFAGDGAG